ncbi:integral membrane protein 2C-like isoform X2 [Scleropages formosus]|uniref:integral membrane protein 2C-like isoform X2 n=1 Tax=Scleropages formosus TaxID=113540 RepID=UPI000878FB71|nr:integral membrane protein 2C-like isoform X2 [Scleropages formosus]
MVKITLHGVGGHKADKEGDGDKAEVLVPCPPHEELGLRLHPKRSPVKNLWCLVVSLVVVLCGLVLASVYLYRHYFISQQVPEENFFHCRVLYEDSIYAPLRGRQELEENVGIYLKENYEQISVPLPRFGGSDPADIVHDFHRGLTAYHDLALDKCYIIELNTSIVMPPRSLWELLINVKRGSYLPQTYLIQEEMVVTGRVWNLRPLGFYIQRLCSGKETYRLRRHHSQRRINKREAQNCHSIRHFENTFVVETVICDSV